MQHDKVEQRLMWSMLSTCQKTDALSHRAHIPAMPTLLYMAMASSYLCTRLPTFIIAKEVLSFILIVDVGRPGAV
jgi:hypothetical protein